MLVVAVVRVVHGLHYTLLPPTAQPRKDVRATPRLTSSPHPTLYGVVSVFQTVDPPPTCRLAVAVVKVEIAESVPYIPEVSFIGSIFDVIAYRLEHAARRGNVPAIEDLRVRRRQKKRKNERTVCKGSCGGMEIKSNKIDNAMNEKSG